jgi:hypothetical protein
MLHRDRRFLSFGRFQGVVWRTEEGICYSVAEPQLAWPTGDGHSADRFGRRFARTPFARGSWDLTSAAGASPTCQGSPDIVTPGVTVIRQPGVADVFAPPLSAFEEEELHRSATVIREALDGLGLSRGRRR